MRFFSYILASFLLAPGSAVAAGAAEARLEVQRAREAAQGSRWQQAQLRGELNEVAGRIQELKAQQRGRLLPGGELSEQLRRSQELSSALTEVEAALARAEGEVQQRSGALVDALDGELDSVRAAFDGAGREERRALLGRMRALRLERDQARAQLPEARLPQVKGEDSDDPADLLEQADALRDTQDKVAVRLKALGRRIAELERERELDRRMGEFLGDEQAFDERDRRLVGNGVAGLQADAREPMGPLGPVTISTASLPETKDPGSPPGGAARGGPARDGQPQVGMGATLPEGGDEDLAAVLKQRQELEALSRDLGARAGELERRARELK